MAKNNGAKTSPTVEELDTEEVVAEAETTIAASNEEQVVPPNSSGGTSIQDIDESLNALKALVSTVEKLQKVRQEVGDIKPLLIRMLDGELVSGDDLEQLKLGVGGLSRLVKAYSDHQTTLVKAQAARDLLDQVLK